LPKNCKIPAPRQGNNSEFCGNLRRDRANTGPGRAWREDAENHQGKTAFSLVGGKPEMGIMGRIAPMIFSKKVKT